MISRRSAQIALFLIIVCLSRQAYAQASWTHTAEADQLCREHFDRNNLVGMSVAVAHNGKIVYAKGFGWQDRERNAKATEMTRYRLASVSKPITSLIAMELVTRKKLDLDRKVREYLPDLPAGHDYTARHLLSHTSGMRHYAGAGDKTTSVKQHYATLADAVKLFIDDDLKSQPGEKYQYSTHGFSVLGRQIEAITKAPFERYAASRFRAWGIDDLNPESDGTRNKNRSALYERKDGQNRPAERDDLSWKYPGGGYECSAHDLCKLGIKVLDGKILPRANLDTLWTVQTVKTGTSTYGLGWVVGSDNGKRVVTHSGSQSGAASIWRIYPDDGVVVVVLANMVYSGPADLSRNLAALAFK